MIYAYRKESNHSEFNIHEAATQPFMGLTAFLRPNDPWLVIAHDNTGHTLVNREGTKVTLKTPFDWIEATDRSKLVAALCSGECPIPGTPHFSAEENDWFFRVQDNIFEPEDVVEHLAAWGDYDEDFLEHPDPDSLDNSYENYSDACPECNSPFSHNPVYGTFCANCGYSPEDNYDDQINSFGATTEGHQVQTPDSRADEKADSSKCPQCGSHTIGNRIAEFTDDGRPIFHCKSCGNKFESGEHTIVNPKLTYQVDHGQKLPEGNHPHPYAPGPDNPKRICGDCGYSWASHHEFSITGGKCPQCGKQQDVQGLEGGEGWKNPKRHSTFENDTQNSMSGKDTDAVNQSNPLEYRNTDIVQGESNNTPQAAPVMVHAGPNGPFAVKGNPIEGVNWQGNSHGPFSVLPEDVQQAQQLIQQHAKIARRNFTPAEQKSLIEEGLGASARNIDKLDLSNSHYIEEDPDEIIAWW